MLKLVVTMKRKPGMSREEYRSYYETRHAKLMKLTSEYVLDYRRSYPLLNPTDPEKIYNPSGAELINPDNSPFDCMTEVWLKDAEALGKLYELMARPDVAALVKEDNSHFQDPSTIRYVLCEEHRGWPAENSTGPAPQTVYPSENPIDAAVPAGLRKLVVFVKRKPGLTPEEYRSYYETKHTRLTRPTSQYVLDYRRSYPVPNPISSTRVYNPSGAGLIDPYTSPFDSMAEVWLKDDETLGRLYDLLAQPDLAALIKEDTLRFTDRSTIRFVLCEECRGWPD